jgi:hypothetical protein
MSAGKFENSKALFIDLCPAGAIRLDGFFAWAASGFVGRIDSLYTPAFGHPLRNAHPA